MIDNFKKYKKEANEIDLKLNEIKDYMIRSFVDEFNNTNEKIKLEIISGYGDCFINYVVKDLNLPIYENKKDMSELNFNNIIRKGKITIDGKEKIDLIYTDKFKENYSNFLEIYTREDFQYFIFNSRVPKIYQTLDNNIKMDLNDDRYLSTLISEYGIFEIKTFLNQYDRFLLNQNKSYSLYCLDENTHLEKIKTFNINQKYIEENIKVLEQYNFRNYSIEFIKNLILKSNLFDNQTKIDDISIKFNKKQNEIFRTFLDFNNCIRNYLKFSPEKSLEIMTLILEINKTPTEIVDVEEKLKLLSIMGVFSRDKNNMLELYYNNDNIIKNIGTTFDLNRSSYIKSIAKTFLFVEDNFEIIEKLNSFYDNIKEEKHEFIITNLKTNKEYKEEITFEEFFNKFVIHKKELENKTFELEIDI